MSQSKVEEKLIFACKISLEVMESEKAQWDGTCDLFDRAIDACKEALKCCKHNPKK